ncbi:MAG: hemerythrin domain-containing protein [Acidimicrobiales bacterium]
MPNAIKMLQDDNNSMHILLGQVQMIPAGQADAEDKAAAQVASMFTTHSRLEDEFITPILTELHPELAAESDDEHDRAKRLLARIEDLPAGLARRHVVAEFSEVVRAHMVTQEASVFPFLIEMLDVGEIENLGRRMQAAEQPLRRAAADTTGAAETAGHRVYPQL